ncbi:MAG: TetR/AcrR family transcriptional regulator [Pseudomonadota bacterium]
MAPTAISKGSRAPKRGQLDRTRGLILSAAVELLGQRGYRDLTIERISTESGVARSTIYRHFDSIPDIAMQAFEVILGDARPLAGSGSIRADLIAVYERLVQVLERSRWGKVLPAMVEAAIADAAFAKLLYRAIDQRRAPTEERIAQAIERGELPAGTAAATLLDPLTGAIYFRLLFTDRPLATSGEIERWVFAAVAAAQHQDG